MKKLHKREVGRDLTGGYTSSNFIHDLNWQWKYLSLSWTLRGHHGCVNSLDFDPTGQFLASGSDDTSVRVWDYESRKLSYSFESKHTQNILSVRFLKEGRFLGTCSYDGQIKFFDLEGHVSRTRRCHTSSPKRLECHPSTPSTVLSCGDDGTVRLHDLREDHACSHQECKNVVADLRRSHTKEYSDNLYTLRINPLASHIFATAGQKGTVYVYDTRNSRAPFLRLTPRSNTLFFCGISGLDFSKDGLMLAANCLCALDASVALFNMQATWEDPTLLEPAAASPSPAISNTPVDETLGLMGSQTLSLPTAAAAVASHSGLLAGPSSRSSRRHMRYATPPRASEPLRISELREGLGTPGSPSRGELPLMRGPWSESCMVTPPQDEWAVVREAVALKPKAWSITTSSSEHSYPDVDYYTGHMNIKTIKEVIFVGDRSEYIVSGSDDGQLYMWSRLSKKVVSSFRGDNYVVNCIREYPAGIGIATSGIDHHVRLWEPALKVNRRDVNDEFRSSPEDPYIEQAWSSNRNEGRGGDDDNDDDQSGEYALEVQSSASESEASS
eukprot:Rmarinus@m.15465